MFHRYGTELVQDIVSRSIEIFSILKSMQVSCFCLNINTKPLNNSFKILGQNRFF